MMKKLLFTAAVFTVLAATPAMAGTWKQTGNSWWYLYDDGGYPANGIVEIEGSKYCFDASGYMVTGWTWVNGAWHYCNSDGRMPEGCWIEDGGKWYLLDDDNSMRTGWYNDGKNQYYLYKAEDVYNIDGAVEGAMATGTITISGVTYYFDAQGKQVNTMRDFENNGIKYRYKDGAFQWQDINKKNEWIQYDSPEQLAFDIQEKLIERYQNDHSYTSARKFEEEARQMLERLLTEAEIEEYIDDTLAEEWGSSYRRSY